MGNPMGIGNKIRKILGRKKTERIPFSELFVRFQNIIRRNNAAMERIADMGGKAGGEFLFDKKYLSDCVEELEELVRKNAYDLNFMVNNKYLAIYDVIENLSNKLKIESSGKIVLNQKKTIFFLDEIDEHMQDALGYKAFNLSRIIKYTNARVPKGFVVTIGGFRKYLAYNNLFDKIARQMEAYQQNSQSAEAVSKAIRLMILAGDIPPDLRREILLACDKISNQARDAFYHSVRSSAASEGGDLSFAGLHDSFLNVSFDEVLSYYKKVMASLYNPAALEYRREKQLFPMEMAMAVLFQEIVKSRVSGVLFTVDPNEPEKPESILSANWGLGSLVVSSEGQVDTFRISRRAPYIVLESKIGSKSRMAVPFEIAAERDVPVELRDKPCLTDPEAAGIVEAALNLERYFKQPLDVEWSLDDNGELWIVQARPMHLTPQRHPLSEKLTSILKHHRILIQNRGVIAYRGIGSGPVWIADDRDDLSRFPSGAVLVSRFGPPWLAEAIPRASAVVTDIGSATAHMTTVAREFRVPTIVDSAVATQVLVPGQEVTVDANRNVIYEGRITELLQHQLLTKAFSFESTYEFQLLRRLLRRIAPLSLTDPQSAHFTAESCQTFHDIMRFVHEKAIQALTQVGRSPRSLLQQGGKRLKSEIPLDLVLIDIGGGLAASGDKDIYVTPEQIISSPMKALWRGLSSPQAWSTEPVAVDIKNMMSSLTRTQTAQVMGHIIPGVNLAVIGADYMNLNLRVGYHISTVDAGIGSSPENNYIVFRFIGGVSDIAHRSRRAHLLMSILESIGFIADVKGDLVIARATHQTEKQMREHLGLIGKLLGFSRQLDVLLKNDDDIGTYFEKFMNQLIKPLENHNMQEGT